MDQKELKSEFISDMATESAGAQANPLPDEALSDSEPVHAMEQGNPLPDEPLSDSEPASATEQEQTRTAQLYDRFTERSRELFEAGHEKSKDAMEKAMETARVQLNAAGEFSAEQGEVFKKFMRRDLDQTAADIKVLGQEAKERLHPARLGAGALSSLSKLLDVAGAALQNLSQKAEIALHFRTGEITTAGTLTCMHCGKQLQLKRTAHIPPCPSCSGTEFRKSY